VQTDSVAAALQQTAIFGELNDSALQDLAQVCLQRTYRRGQFLWYEGDSGDYLLVIVRGLVKVTVTSPRGDEMLLVTLGPSEVVGELSVIDGGARSASVVALTPTTGIVIGRAPLIALMQRSPELLDVLLRSMGALVRRLKCRVRVLVERHIRAGDRCYSFVPGFGAAVWVNGYRCALLVASAGSLLLADHIGWPNTYLLLAVLMAAGVVTILLSPEPSGQSAVPASLAEAVGGPLKEFFTRPGVVGLLALIVLYKVGDAVAASLQTAFLIGGMGFSVSEVGYVKGLGLGATLLGALAGGVAMAKMGMVRSLLLFGLLQAVSNLGFMWLAWIGKSYLVLMTSILVENVTGGMGTAAFIALIMSLCDHRYTATQFALLSSLEALGRVFSGRPSAELVEMVGWAQFFFWSFLLALPGVWLVWAFRSQLQEESGHGEHARAVSADR